MIGNVSGPKASDVAVEKVPFDRLTETGSAPGGINFPSRVENQRASHGDVRLRTWTLLESDDIAFDGCDVLLDAPCLAIDGSNMPHTGFLSAK
jgi:hypothetical protein